MGSTFAKFSHVSTSTAIHGSPKPGSLRRTSRSVRRTHVAVTISALLTIIVKSSHARSILHAATERVCPIPTPTPLPLATSACTGRGCSNVGAFVHVAVWVMTGVLAAALVALYVAQTCAMRSRSERGTTTAPLLGTALADMGIQAEQFSPDRVPSPSDCHVHLQQGFHHIKHEQHQNWAAAVVPAALPVSTQARTRRHPMPTSTKRARAGRGCGPSLARPMDLNLRRSTAGTIIDTRTLASGGYGTVKEALWVDPPTYFLAKLGATRPSTSLELPRKTLPAVKVAVKYVHVLEQGGATYSRRSLDSVVRELQVLCQVHHPNIIPCFDTFWKPPLMCLIMQLAEPGSLHRQLYWQRNGCTPVLAVDPVTGRLTYQEVLRLGSEIASAMAHLHGCGIIHRDLKPGNVLIDTDGKALVADFGISKCLESGAQTTTNLHHGTVPYKAPELLDPSDGTPPSWEVDQYAFGAMLWECMAGHYPWRDRYGSDQFGSDPQILAARITVAMLIRDEKLEVPKECPPFMCSLITACCSRDPTQRPPFTQLEVMLREELRHVREVVTPVHTTV